MEIYSLFLMLLPFSPKIKKKNNNNNNNHNQHWNFLSVPVFVHFQGEIKKVNLFSLTIWPDNKQTKKKIILNNLIYTHTHTSLIYPSMTLIITISKNLLNLNLKQFHSSFSLLFHRSNVVESEIIIHIWIVSSNRIDLPIFNLTNICYIIVQERHIIIVFFYT